MLWSTMVWSRSIILGFSYIWRGMGAAGGRKNWSKNKNLPETVSHNLVPRVLSCLSTGARESLSLQGTRRRGPWELGCASQAWKLQIAPSLPPDKKESFIAVRCNVVFFIFGCMELTSQGHLTHVTLASHDICETVVQVTTFVSWTLPCT